MASSPIPDCFIDGPPIAAEVARGVTRLFCRHDLFAMCEVPLPNGRRADLMAIGPKAPSTTMAQVTQVEHMLGAQVTGATWDPSFAVWRAALTDNRATVTMNPSGGSVEQPIFRFTGFTGTAAPVVKLDGQPTAVPVETGASDGQHTEVRSGLKEGDVVLTGIARGGAAGGGGGGGGAAGGRP